jgi:hypothetical protein
VNPHILVAKIRAIVDESLFFTEAHMHELQVYSPQEVDFGSYVKMFWVQGFPGDGSVVPPHHTLEITTLTLNYFPKTTGGTIGRADIAGRDSANLSTGTAIWRLQVVYVEPQKTVHLTFPKPLRLEAGGHVEIGFVDNGPGTILVEANGVLVRR